MVAYSAIVCLILLGLGGYCLSYETRQDPPQPPLEESWVGETPFLVEPDQSVTITYTITYNWTGTGSVAYAQNGTLLEIENRRAPANTFEVREYDGGYYTTDIVISLCLKSSRNHDPVPNASFAVKVYSPSGEVLNEDNGAQGRGWSIEEPGTYRIVITNLSSSEPLEIYGTFQFNRNRYYRPYARLGYVTFSVALGFIVVALIGKLKSNRSIEAKKYLV